MYDGMIKAPFRDVLAVNSSEQEKQAASEMLGALLNVEPFYRDDTTLMHDLRAYQQKYNIPAYDYQFCLAGPMTLNSLVTKYLASDAKCPGFYRKIVALYDPIKNPGVVNMRGNDIVEFQLMYNAWTIENGKPPLGTGNGNNTYLLEVDGYYGRFSKTAAINFQKSEIFLDQKEGVVDAKTWKLLYLRTYLARDLIVKQLIQWSNTYLP